MERAQTDFDYAVEIPPLRIAMNSKLLKAAKSGDKKILDELLRRGEFSSKDSVGQIAIAMPDDAATQNDTQYLLGVTPEGNTALHIVASQKKGHLEFAMEICRRERSLLAAPNTRLDTPLHRAARAGDDKMVSLIIQFASEDGIQAKRVLLSARNMNEANALHEAAQYDHVHVAEVLMEEDAGLASMLNAAGMSPLYLAILTESFNVAKALLWSSSWDNASRASYEGPDKKTALHVAVHVSRDITQDLLRLKPMLAKAVDSSGRIPLHYAASDGHHNMVKLLLEHDPSTAYLSDANGSFPIHIAASMGNFLIVDQILNQCPDTEESLDKEGKNFLHVAFKHTKLYFIRRIIRKRPDLRKLLNEKDNKGNTPLHTAITNSDLWSVNFLLRDKSVYHNIINHDGFTPLDLANTKMDKGLRFWMNASSCIAKCLALTKAPSAPRKLDSLKSVGLSSDEIKEKPSGNDNIEEKSSPNEAKEIEKELNISRNLGIASVLIATVTFAAGFTLPGGYRADDHPGRGTAVLAKEYAFKVFLVSDAFAFICSVAATCWLMYAGTSVIDRYTRMRILYGSMNFLWVAFAGMSTAFVMGIYAVSAPSSKSIRFLLCIIALGTPLFVYVKANYNCYSLLRTVRIRQGHRQCICPTVRHHVFKRHGRTLLVGANAIWFWLLILGCYALFFLLAKL